MKKDLSKCIGWQLEKCLGHRKLLRAGFVGVVVLIALGLICLDLLVGPASAATTKTFKGRLGHGLAATTPLQHASLKFAELVKEQSKGRLEIGVYPSAQLGNLTELVESVRMGTVEMYAAGNGFIEVLSPRIGLVNLPGLMRDLDHVYKVMYRFALKEVYTKSLLPMGIRPLGFVSNDFRHVTNSKRPIKTLADLKGLKIRVPNNKVFMDTLAAMGGSPVPIDYAELFTALQQGVVDGQENPFMNIWSAKFYEVQKHLALTYHMWDTFTFLINEKFFQSLDPDLQKIVVEAGREAADYGWKEMGQLNAKLLADLKGFGMQVTEVDRQEIQKAVRPVWDSWIKRVGPEGNSLIQSALEIK